MACRGWRLAWLLAGVVALGACTRKASVDDALFEAWLRTQLLAMATWRLSGSLDDPRNARLQACLWQFAVQEKDCVVPKDGTLMPVSLRFGDGSLATEGVALPSGTAVSNALVEKKLNGRAARFGFTEQWRPCVGAGCRYQVFTAVEPVCLGGASVCGRAQTLRVSYAILSRNVQRSLFSSREITLHDRRVRHGKGPVVVAVEALLEAMPVTCSVSGAAALVINPQGTPQCFVEAKEVKNLCPPRAKDFLGLQAIGACKGAQNCRALCQVVSAPPGAHCAADMLERDFWTPDVFRCRKPSRVVFFESSLLPQDKASTRTGVGHFLARLLATNSSSIPACLFRTKLCLGAKQKPKHGSLKEYVPLRPAQSLLKSGAKQEGGT
jgi:hypothetical protein